jgi:hypothetical protein
MAASLSREVVTAGSPGQLVIFGRLKAGVSRIKWS